MRSAAILVGGSARRLAGRDKSALTVGARSIMARQMDVLAAVGVGHVSLIGRPRAARPPALHLVADAVEDTGALGGLYTALLAAPDEYVLVIACDLPFLGTALLGRLFAEAERTIAEAKGRIAGTAGVDAVVPRTARGWHPLAAVYHRRIATRVKARLDRRALRVIDALDDLVVKEIGPDAMADLDPAGVSLVNVNTPEDYDRACRLARSHECRNAQK